MSPGPARLAALAALAALLLLAGCASQPVGGPDQPLRPGQLPDGLRADVAILETTDLASHILGYDYHAQKVDPTLGFEHTVTLIRRARDQFTNTFLFDDGDTIQGTALADYQARVKPLPCDQELAMYRAMDAVGYDGGTLGSHDFDYGLTFLSQVTGTPMDVDGVPVQHCAGPHYPLVLANVVSTRDGKPIFKPWTIIHRQIAAYTPDGSQLSVPLKVAIIGFTAPPTTPLDPEGRVTVTGVVATAEKYLPQIEAQHPDLVIALLHGGLDTSPYTPAMENGGWYLAGVHGIDVLLLGRMHAHFPGPRFAHMQDVDDVNGFVRSVPAVMGGFFGKDLGVVKLALAWSHGHWTIDQPLTHSRVWPICSKPGDDASCVPADPAIAPLLDEVQKATVAYLDTPTRRSPTQTPGR